MLVRAPWGIDLKELIHLRYNTVQAARTSALPKSVLAKACNYTLTLWTRLTRFLKHTQLNTGSDAEVRKDQIAIDG
jgi:hypothetical protein